MISKAGLLAMLLLSCLCRHAQAIMPTAQMKADAPHFAYHQRRAHKPHSIAVAQKAVWDFNHKRKLTASAKGQFFAGAKAATHQRALEFLAEAGTKLGIDPSTLTLEKESGAAGHKHLLYRQNYKGIPVETVYVKIHLADNGALLGIDSNYESNLKLNTNPSISEGSAAGAVKRDEGVIKVSPGTLVILPDPQGGPAVLAWKFTANVKGSGRLRYFVDARTGQIVFRYNPAREVTCTGPAGTSGNMSAMIYDQDPSGSTPLAVRPLNHMTVYQGDQFTSANTNLNGDFCGAGVGKIFTQFQGPFVRVGNFRGQSADYNNGNGGWTTVATPVSSPHPYPDNANILSTIDLRGTVPPGAVKFLPIFSNFSVGSISHDVASEAEGGDIIDDSQVTIFDSSMNPVAAYIGDRGGFNAAGVPGQVMYLRLKATATGTNTGYDVSQSSYLTLGPNPYLDAGAGDSLVWYGTNTYIGALGNGGGRSEFNLFYHLNMMHDFFMFGNGTGGVSEYGNGLSGVDISSAAFIGNPMHALAYVGPNIVNAFYDPDYDNLVFGDVSDITPEDLMTDDATIPHHEYTHYVVEKIWSLQNFGEAGAISEGNADYFSATSLNDPSIALYAVTQLSGNPLPLRQLSSTGGPDTCGQTPAILGNASTPWIGEIHCDGRFMSQALWDIRTERIAAQGGSAGQACADGLAFQTLLFFPESFSEYLNAMLTVDNLGLVPACAVNACGGNPVDCVQGEISAAFAAHGIVPVGGTNDPYDTVTHRDDGFETAVDVATIPIVHATIYPTGDLDFYTFPAGPGPVVVTMDLPADPLNPGVYKGYMMTLFDVDHRQVAQQMPNMDGTNSVGGFCADTDCTTSQHTVTLAYNNPQSSQLFLEVSGGITFDGNSNSGVSSTSQYVLSFSFPHNGAIAGGVVSAGFDKDIISFAVNVTTWVRTQDYNFAYAQLRDQSGNLLPNTLTHSPIQAGDWLAMLSSTSALGQISGSLQLQPGFAARFPSIGTVELEAFAYDHIGSTVSFGLSQPFNLSSNEASLTAYNNIFNPNKGQQTTVKYEIQNPGHVTLRLYTINGTYVATLLDNDEPAGKGSVTWGGLNVSGQTVASGVYLLYMKGPGVDTTQKIVVVK
jgi:hypothetical protein